MRSHNWDMPPSNQRPRKRGQPRAGIYGTNKVSIDVISIFTLYDARMETKIQDVMYDGARHAQAD